MISIWICDDNKRMALLIARFIERDLNKKGAEYQMEVYYSGSEIVDILSKDNRAPDILFLAVKMKKTDGMAVSREFSKRYCRTLIIYVSAYPEALDRVSVSEPFGCILKSNINTEISYFLEKALRRLFILPEKVLWVKSRGMKLEIPERKIIYFICSNKAVVIHTDDEKQIVIRDSLKRLSGELNKEGFIFVNRGVLINIRFLVKIHRREVYLKAGTVFLCSESRWTTIKKAYSTGSVTEKEINCKNKYLVL